MGEGIKTRRGKSKGIAITLLYDAGNECVDLTGGWEQTFASGGTVTLEATRIKLLSTSGGVTIGKTVSAIDVTNYDTLEVTVYGSWVTTNFKIGLASAGGSSFYYSAVAQTWCLTTPTPVTYSLDLSAVSGAYYVALMSANVATAYVTLVTLK